MTKSKTTSSLPKFNEVMSTVWNGYIANQSVIWKVVVPYIFISALQGILTILLPDVYVVSLLTIALIVIAIWTAIVITRIMYQITITGKVDEESAKQDIGNVVWPYIGVSIIVGILVMLGSIAFIVPGIILFLMYFGSSYAAIIDKKNIGDSMKYSLKITNGWKWNMFTLLFSTGATATIMYLIISAVVVFLLTLAGGLISKQFSEIIIIIASSTLNGIFLPFTTGICVMVYGNLKKLAK